MGYKIDPVTGSNINEPDSGGGGEEGFLKNKKKIAMAAGIAGAVLLLIIIIVVAVVVSGDDEHPDDWLMIVGGYHWYRGEDGQYEGHVYNDTTLLALEPEQNPVPECLKPREFLFDTAWMHGGTDGDGFPFVCGGDRVNDTGYLVPDENCYRYSPQENLWVGAGEWPHRTINAAYGFGRSLGLVAAGGYTGSEEEHHSIVTATTDGKTFTNIADMPIKLSDHCVVVLEDGLFVAAGETDDPSVTEEERTYRTNAYLYSMATKSWKEIEGKLKSGRQKPVCGHIHGPYGTEVIVGGGIIKREDDGATVTTTTEIFNIGTGNWRNAYPMEYPPIYAEGVPHVKSNIFVGGYFLNHSHAIQYNVSSDHWDHLGDKPIQEPWLGFVGALTVKKSIFPKCN